MGYAHRLTGPPRLDAAMAGHRVMSRLRVGDEPLLAENERRATLAALGGTLPTWVHAMRNVDDRLALALTTTDAVAVDAPDELLRRASLAAPAPVPERTAAAPRPAAPGPVRPHAAPIGGRATAARRRSHDRPDVTPATAARDRLSRPAAAASDSGDATQLAAAPTRPTTTGPVVVSAAGRPLERPLAAARSSARARRVGAAAGGHVGSRAQAPSAPTAAAPAPAAIPHDRETDATTRRPAAPMHPGAAPVTDSPATRPPAIRTLADLAERYQPRPATAPPERHEAPTAEIEPVPVAAGPAPSSGVEAQRVAPRIDGRQSGVDQAPDSQFHELGSADPAHAPFLAAQLAELVGEATAHEARRQGLDLEGLFT